MKYTLLSFPAFALLLAGCSDMALMSAEKGDYAQDTGWAPEDDADGEIDASTLRFDIYPSTADLLPQTHIFSGKDWSNVEIELDGAVRVYGSVQGWDATPHFAVTVPGDDTAVSARVAVQNPHTIGGAADWTDPESGAFAVHVPPGDGYQFSVVPESPSELPFYVLSDLEIRYGTNLAVDLGYGVPLYGQVLDRGDVPVMGVTVRAVDPATGVEGPAVLTDSDGWYMLRVFPGTWNLVVSGQEGGYRPTLTTEAVVPEEAGLELDVRYGAVDPVSVHGTVVDSSGIGVGDVTVRFTATDLTHNPDGKLVIETETDQYGQYSARVQEGSFVMEMVPPVSRPVSPLRQVLDVDGAPGITEIGETTLEDYTSVESTVLDPLGMPLSGVNVTAVVEGFDGQTFNTITDANGWFVLSVPRTVLAYTLVPPSNTAAVRRIRSSTEDFPSSISLTQGRLIDARVSHEGDDVTFASVEVRDASGTLVISTFTDDVGAFSLRVEPE